MPLGGGGSSGSLPPIFDANIDPNADINPTKLAYTSMGAWLRKTTNQSISHATLTPINFTDGDIADFVPSGYTELHSTVTNPSRITLRQRGFWLVAGFLAYNGATGTGTSRYCYLLKNGAAIIAPWTYVTLASAPLGVMAVGITYTTLNTDYVEMAAYHDQGVGSTINVGDFGSGTFFGAAFLGDFQ